MKLIARFKTVVRSGKQTKTHSLSFWTVSLFGKTMLMVSCFFGQSTQGKLARAASLADETVFPVKPSRVLKMGYALRSLSPERSNKGDLPVGWTPP